MLIYAEYIMFTGYTEDIYMIPTFKMYAAICSILFGCDFTKSCIC